MIEIPASEFDLLLLAHSPLLDVRAPLEYARGRIPNATSLPLLTDDERARVGRCYKRSGLNAALRLGHNIVSGEIRAVRLRAWCDWADAHPTGAIYCMRGGQRSQIISSWLAQTGREIPVIAGGYKALRGHLLTCLETLGGAASLIVIGGRTGTAKTDIIENLPRSIDLEGLARHRGSAFGQRLGGQPTPIDFENHLALHLLTLANAGAAPIAVEDESRNIGRLSVPASLIANMNHSPLALVEMPLEFRIDVTLNAYIINACHEHQAILGEEAGFAAFAAQLRNALNRLRRRLGGVRYSTVMTELEAALSAHRQHNNLDAHRGWIRHLLVEYYDPMYDHQLASKQGRVAFRGTVAEVRAWVTDKITFMDGGRDTAPSSTPNVSASR